MSGRCFEVLPHTADKRIKAYGDSLVELFKNAALGMFSLMARLEDYTPSEAREFGIEAVDLESLLRDWLAELLYVFEVDRILFVDFEIHSLEGCIDNPPTLDAVSRPVTCRLKATARGLPFDHGIEWQGSAVKAVTRHDLYIKETEKGFEAQIIFDV